MQVVTSLKEIRKIYPNDEFVVTIGNFDGIHLGHQMLIERTVKSARTLGAKSAVLTFDPHPRAVLKPDQTLLLLSNRDQKLKMFFDMKIDLTAMLDFSEVRMCTAEAFFRDQICCNIPLRGVVLGYNFRFGKDRGGSIADVRAFSKQYHFDMNIVDPCKRESEVISSSTIRQRATLNDWGAVQEMLGRRYAITGRVVSGDGRGSQIGFPTANLDVEGQYLPASSVWAVWVDVLTESRTERVSGGFDSQWKTEVQKLKGVMNIGMRPTFQTDGKMVAEVHLIGETTAVNEKILNVTLVKKIREEMKFENVEMLIQQINKDVSQAKQILV